MTKHKQTRDLGEGIRRGQLYVEQNVTKAHNEYGKLREYVRTTKRLTKFELNKLLDRIEPFIRNAMNTGEYID